MTTVLIIGASRGIGLETVKLALSEAGKSSMSHGAVTAHLSLPRSNEPTGWTTMRALCLALCSHSVRMVYFQRYPELHVNTKRHGFS